MIPDMLKEKLLELLSKAGISEETIKMVESELGEEKEDIEKDDMKEDDIEKETPAKVEVSVEAKPISEEDIDNMSEEEVKAMLKAKMANKKDNVKEKILNQMKGY